MARISSNTQGQMTDQQRKELEAYQAEQDVRNRLDQEVQSGGSAVQQFKVPNTPYIGGSKESGPLIIGDDSGVPTANPYKDVITMKDGSGYSVIPQDKTAEARAIAYTARQAEKAQDLNINLKYDPLQLEQDLGISPQSALAAATMGSPGTMDFNEEYDLKAPYGNLGQLSSGVSMLDPESRKQEVQRLIDEGFLRVGEGGILEKVNQDQMLNQMTPEMEQTYNSILTGTGEGTGVEAAKSYLKGALGKPMMSARGTHRPASLDTIQEVMDGLWTNSNKLKNLFGNAAVNNPELQTVFNEWTGDSTGIINDSLYLQLLLAYYRAMEEASYADYSDDDKWRHEKLKSENGGFLTEELFRSKRFDRPNVWQPRKRILSEKIGDYIEEVTRAKFKNPTQKAIIGEGLLSLVQNSDILGHLPNSKYVIGEKNLGFKANPSSESTIDPITGQQISKGYRFNNNQDTILDNKNNPIVEDVNGKVYIVEDIKMDDRLRDFLFASKGIRDLMQPNFRNNVRITPKPDSLKRELDSPFLGKTSGVSYVRTNAMNIQEEMPMMINPRNLNFVKNTYVGPEEGRLDYAEGADAKKEDIGLKWFNLFNEEFSFKPQHYHIILQQDAYIKENSPDGKTWYPDIKRRSSGRSGHDTLLMTDHKIMRGLTIPRDYSYTMSLAPIDGKMNQEESDHMNAILMYLGFDGKIPAAYQRQIKNILNHKKNNNGIMHPWIKLGMQLNHLADSNGLPEKSIIDGNGNIMPNELYIDPDTLKPLINDGTLGEGVDSLFALMELSDYVAAKENEAITQYQTKFIGTVDAAQSGPTIQSIQIGNIRGAISGGLGVLNWMHKDRLKKASDKKNNIDPESRFDLPKLYATTAEKARGYLQGEINAGRDNDYIDFIKILFADAQNPNNFDKLWNKSSAFAKTGLVGASYGQGTDGSIMSIAAEITKHLEESIPDADFVRIVNNLRSKFGSDVSVNPNGRLVLQGKAWGHLNKIAETYVNSMNEAEPRLKDYSKYMRKAFKTYVKFAKLAQDNPDVMGPVSAPKMTYKEPSGISMEAVWQKNWIDGMSTSMIENHIPSDWKTFDIMGSEILFQEGIPVPNLDAESEALKFTNDVKSAGISRFPVISIHGLDDLVQSITISEMNRLYPDDFKFFLSVWDAGRVPTNMLRNYSNIYNKVFEKVMKENDFFKQLTNGFREAINSIEIRDNKGTRLADKFLEKGRKSGVVNEYNQLKGMIADLEAFERTTWEGEKYKPGMATTTDENVEGKNTLFERAEMSGGQIKQMFFPDPDEYEDYLSSKESQSTVQSAFSGSLLDNNEVAAELMRRMQE